ncbi:hypothetical protein KFE94_02465 [bacterium SCSIO 12643]|nr:hypothetical protein KFE94_02465 [bacterium SCSIO 12643]
MSKGFIHKIEDNTSDYQDIYTEGLELLQRLSGAEWTDFNEHDPGVTILENLSYIFTDVNFKTQIPIQDILTESKGKRLKSGDNGFFIPSEILTTNPITENDYRKIFIDQITNVKNVWLKVQGQNQHNDDSITSGNNLKGLYHLFIELYDYDNDPEDFAEEKNRIIDEAQTLFHAHRNLCEDLYGVTIFSPFHLQMDLTLNLDSNTNGEEILAQIYYQIDDFLTHEILFYSLWELQDQDENINQIFNGPLLENGFIKESELKGRLRKIIPSDIVKIIAKIDGVISVDQFLLSYKENNIWTPIPESGLSLPENTSPILLFPSENKHLIFKNEGVAFSPDLNEVQKQFSYIQAMNYGSFKSVSQSINTIDIPKGESKNVVSYYPVRYQFPTVYGIGQFGLQTGLPPQRYAQANQLKAYLLPFDQLFANFLSQLGNLYTLYDVRDDNYQSYFYQSLSDMDKLTELVSSNKHSDTLHHWEDKLHSLNHKFDSNAIQRLNEVADNLLARFAEQFPTYALRKINTNSYGKRLTDESFETDLLSWKRKLVKHYGELSYNRAKAYDYTQPIDISSGFIDLENKLTPGLIQKTAILMGIHNPQLKSLSEVILTSGIKVYQKKDGVDIVNEKLEILLKTNDMEIILADDIVIVDDKVENLRDAFYFLGNSNSILDDTLKNGVIRRNYTIKETSGDHKKSYYVLFAQDGGNSNIIHISESEQEAKDAIDYSIRFLVELNKKSEGLYLVEHLLLAPSYHGNHFGFSFTIPLNDNTEIEFNHFELKSIGDRNSVIEELIENLIGSGSLQFRSITCDNKYVIQILNKNGDQLAVTVNAYDHKHESENEIKKIVDQLYTFAEKYFADRFTHFAYYGEGQKVDETFFTFQISFILPAWPVRFQSESFKAKFNNIVFEQVPAHIAFQSYWLDLNEMVAFEKLYYKWLSLLGKNSLDQEQMNRSYQLIQTIQNLHQQMLQ